MRTILLGLALLSTSVLSLEFNQYCPYTKGEQDCSAEFIQAIKDSSAKNDSLYFSPNETFNIRSIDTKGLHINNVRLVGITEDKIKPTIKTDKFHLFDVSNLYINNLTITGIHNEVGDEEQGTSIVILGTKNEENKASNIVVTNNIFKKSASKSTKKNTSVLNNKPGIGKAIINMAGEKFGNLKETKQTNIHDFLTELDNLLKPKI